MSMILIRMNRLDVVAAETEALAVAHYEKFRNKPRNEIIDPHYYSPIRAEEMVFIPDPFERQEQDITVAQAYAEGKFTLPHVFTKKLRRL